MHMYISYIIEGKGILILWLLHNSYSEEKLVVIEHAVKDDNRKHAAKVATLILPVPEYVFYAYEDGCQIVKVMVPS